MKKLVLVLGAAVLSSGMANESLAGVVDSGTCNDAGTCLWSLDDTGTMTISAAAGAKNVKTNEYVCSGRNCSGTPGNRPWEDYLQDIQHVVVGDNITRIGNDAFQDAHNLQTVSGMNSVEELGNGAFARTDSLTSVDMPNVTKIENVAFADAIALKYVGFDPNKITSWGKWIFGGANTAVQNCASDGSGCGSCGDDLIMPGQGCVSSCGAGYADYNGKCWLELPFSKKHWTPAEVNEWLKDDDNTITITFKKQ